MANFHLLIPARLGSTRLANKALADVLGAPLVVRVWQTATQAGADSVTVVTDHPDIATAVETVGGRALMTSPAHASGTDRLCEAVELLGLDDEAIVVNLQGDEPLMPVACLQQVARVLQAHPTAQLATLFDQLGSEAAWRDPDVVKVLVNNANQALCFSRSPIPYARGGGWPDSVAKRHVGLYAYRVSALRRWPSLPMSEIEQAESLEQWRALSSGWQIVCDQALEPIPAGVDNADDLARVCEAFARLSDATASVDASEMHPNR